VNTAAQRNDRGRVLLITPQPFLEWRGSPIRVGFDARALSGLGWAVDLLAMPCGRDVAMPGVTLHRAPNPLRLRGLPIGPSLAKAAMDLFLLWAALRLARRTRYAVVHAVEDAGPIGALAARVCGAKLVFEKHSDPASYRGAPLRNAVMWLYARVERFSIRRADAVIATGPGLAEQVRRQHPDRRVWHIPDIPSSLAEADEARCAQARRRLQQAAGDVLLLYVGSFAVYQGLDLLFAGIPPVCARHPAARFVIIGGAAGEIAARRAWLRQRGVEERVTFVGQVPPDELPNYLRAADILLSPRLSGANTPLKLLDYLKAGRPIVATDCPANRLILSPANAVLTAPEPEAWAKGISRLIENAEERERLAAAGRRLIAETHNFEEFQRRLGRCYEETLAASREWDGGGDSDEKGATASP